MENKALKLGGKIIEISKSPVHVENIMKRFLFLVGSGAQCVMRLIWLQRYFQDGRTREKPDEIFPGH